MAEELEFRISSGLKNIIGKDLITDDFIAVFELVKNSYDAFAKNVDIIINDDEIIISDDGNGMSLDDLKKKWLFVAYSEKKDSIIEPSDEKKESYRDKIQEKRHFAGSKGIGRFSSDRLGEKLSIITRKKGKRNIEKIDIDWTKFEKDQNKEFEKIKVDHFSNPDLDIQFPNSSSHGTILKITTLHRHWDRTRLKRLKHSLEKLINPFSETNDFNIQIICEKELEEDNGLDKKGEFIYIERDRINGRVNNSILEILNLKTTQISVKIDKNEIVTKIIDRGTLIYHIREYNREYSLLDNVKLDLYFLNTSAKYNFTRKMGIQVVNFGSVFLFKNGFRVQPYGELGDDSWGLDQRKQQGYNRFLGTRDLFGRVDVLTNKIEEFKEVSSRDGGLVETQGNFQLMHAFKDKGLVRLERYVVGVLWGEGFLKKKYFGEGKDADAFAKKHREELIEKDKESDDISTATSTLGSKLDFIQIVKSLASDKNVEILNYNKDFVNLVNEKIDENQTRFISDLEKIAEHTDDDELRTQILRTEKQYRELKKAKEAAERKAQEEELKRQEAEQKAEQEEKARKEAENKAKKEEERRRKAELATLKKEKERAEAEIAKLKAEKKAKEEKDKRKKEEEARRKAESVAQRRKEQVSRYKASESIEYKDLRDSNHIIGVYADDIAKKILLLKRKLDKGKIVTEKDLISFIQGISLANEKIATITRFTTKSNYLQASLETTEDIVGYIANYIRNIYQVLYNIEIEIQNGDLNFIKKFQPIELSTAIDNILSNSRKKNATKVTFEFIQNGHELRISIRDVGSVLSKKIQDGNLVFEEGITTTKGSGLGLNHVKRIVEKDLGGKIKYNPEYKEGFELIITLTK